MRKSIATILLVAAVSGISLAAPTVKLAHMGHKGVSALPGMHGNYYVGEMMYQANADAINQYNLDTDNNGMFVGFCVEINEHVHIGGVYDAVLNTAAVNGGRGGPNPDPLSNETAWLYNYYLDNVHPVATNSIAMDYQFAIWNLEDEISDAELAQYRPSAQSLVDMAEQNANWNNQTIRVLNLYKLGHYPTANHNYFQQDTLVRVTPVPAPGALLLGTIGTAMVGWLRRRQIQ